MDANELYENGETLFNTEFINEQSVHQNVHENGKTLRVLAPGERFHVTAHSPNTSYARWSKIVYERNGVVKLYDNQQWKMPHPRNEWPVEIINLTDTEIQVFRIKGEPVEVYRQIPRLVFVDVTEMPFIWMRELRVVQKLVKRPDDMNPKYLVTESKIVKEITWRAKEECQKIKTILDEAKVGTYRLPQDVEEILK